MTTIDCFHSYLPDVHTYSYINIYIHLYMILTFYWFGYRASNCNSHEYNTNKTDNYTHIQRNCKSNVSNWSTYVNMFICMLCAPIYFFFHRSLTYLFVCLLVLSRWLISINRTKYEKITKLTGSMGCFFFFFLHHRTAINDIAQMRCIDV